MKNAISCVVIILFCSSNSKWDEENYVTISFNSEPRILDEDGNIISECKITDYTDYEFDWIDI